ncbi:MAG: SDR family NAD(P)-dependent oxidoreductase [Henriciella sp.]
MAPDLDFTGKRVLVVGGSSGIGNSTAQGFRKRGAEVAVWGTRASAADYEPSEGCDLTGLHYTQVDVADPKAIEVATLPFDSLDILIQSQGIVAYKQAEFRRPGWDRVMAVNIDSVMDCCEKFRPMLKESSGSIVIISSVAGFRGTFGNPAYGASKAGAVNLTKSLGQAYARDGIRVNGVAPGLVETKMTKVTTENPDRLEGMLKAIPQRRTGHPEDIAGGVLFMASPLASFICGHTLVMDGGMTL